METVNEHDVKMKGKNSIMLCTEIGETGKIHEQYIYVFLPPMQFQRTLKNRKSREARKRVLLKFLKNVQNRFYFCTQK